MAQSEKIATPPIKIHKTLDPIIEAFSVESAKEAKVLIEKAAKAIYEDGDEDDLIGFSFRKPMSEKEFTEVYELIKALQPRDILEAITVSQIVVSHLLAMRKLSQSHRDDQRLGLLLLKLSNDALDRLAKKRSGCIQKIEVAYFNNITTQQYDL